LIGDCAARGLEQVLSVTYFQCKSWILGAWSRATCSVKLGGIRNEPREASAWRHYVQVWKALNAVIGWTVEAQTGLKNAVALDRAIPVLTCAYRVIGHVWRG
jgi:hypothetical protein